MVFKLFRPRKKVPIILIVDDYDKHITLLKREFSRGKKIKIVTAQDGHEGMHRFYQYHPDLIITDLDMPEMHGYEMINSIGRHNGHTPIIIYSVSDIDRRKFMYPGDVIYMNKERKKHKDVTVKALDILSKL